MSRVRIILSRPRNPDNIGAAARAMANFGLEELALAAPHLPSWRETIETAATAGSGEAPWLLERARAAVGASDIIRAAKVFPTAEEAASDCAVLLGTSALQRRTPGRDVILLRDLRAWLAARAGAAGKAGILFGSERTGLSNSELSHCHAVINIPTCEKQPSVNLGQAVALVCYELSGRGEGKGPRAARPPAPAPSVGQTERLVAEICALLDAAKGPGAGKRLEGDIRRGLLDARLTKEAVSALKLLLLRASGK